jgi:hypothetical protein
MTSTNPFYLINGDANEIDLNADARHRAFSRLRTMHTCDWLSDDALGAILDDIFIEDAHQGIDVNAEVDENRIEAAERAVDERNEEVADALAGLSVKLLAALGGAFGMLGLELPDDLVEAATNLASKS